MRSPFIVVLAAASFLAAQENPSSSVNHSDSATKFGFLVSVGFGVGTYLSSHESGVSAEADKIADQTKTGKAIDAICALYPRQRNFGVGMSYRRLMSSGRTSTWEQNLGRGGMFVEVEAAHTLNFIGPALFLRREAAKYPIAFQFQVSLGRILYEERSVVGDDKATLNASGLGWLVGGSVESKIGQEGAFFLQATMLRSRVEADRLEISQSQASISVYDLDDQNVSNMGLSAGIRFYL